MSDQPESTVRAENEAELIRWKTNAWQDPAMVNWYSGRMVQSESTNQLKNAIEINTIKRYARGPDIIDIGVGTGRAALPLITEGYRLTGVDSSQAMLDETRRLAGDAPITLKLGDLTDLPCDGQSFDSAVALNVMVHFPNWREILLGWKRVVRPGGRLIFDIHSHDHVTAAYGKDKALWPEALRPGEFSQYISRIGIEELVSFGDEAGLTIVSVVPYGAFLGGGNTNWLLYEELESKQRWKRTLSWFARYQALFDLGLFLEESLIAWLTPAVCGRMFVVLENKSDSVANAKFALDIDARNRALAQHDIAAIAPWLPLPLDAYAAKFDQLLQPLRARHFFFLLYRALTSHWSDFNFHNALSEDIRQQMSAWIAKGQFDSQAVDIARNWSAGCDEKFKDGVDITLGIEYNLVNALLTQYFAVLGRGGS